MNEIFGIVEKFKPAIVILSSLAGLFGLYYKIQSFFHNRKEKKMRLKQKWPWHYSITEPKYLFPREINDGERSEIFIHYTLRKAKSHKGAFLSLSGTSLHGDMFPVEVSMYDKESSTALGSVCFTKKALAHKIAIPQKYLHGSHTIHLQYSGTPHAQTWLFWECIALHDADQGRLLWQIGKPDQNHHQFHDLRFGFP